MPVSEILPDMKSVTTEMAHLLAKADTLVNIFVRLSHHTNLREEEKIKQKQKHKHKIPAYMYLEKVQTEFDCLMIG